ncbi:hypothetical protein BSZ37_11760 [Rubrivirga marina]|uniref:Uncharacterized protein n=1 Tax=Rubrivirga marina TaxID=1196024 RepID=A0A271J168_9BACT|nr:hypothetical protein BSZ37_11760 [Rubrivirga marina]
MGGRGGGDALIDLWAAVDEGVPTVGGGVDTCLERFGTYNPDFGVRGLACAASPVLPLAQVVERAPVTPFRSGPHTVTADVVAFDFESTAEPRFGRYDPAFVRWAVAHAVPEGASRTLAQPVYDHHVRQIARMYWLAHRDLVEQGYPASLPAGPLADYAAYLRGAPPSAAASVPAYGPGFSVTAFNDESRALLSELGLPLANEYTAIYEGNAAYAFWMRREVDGTRGLWHGGLRDLLAAFDADWLAANG